MKQLASIHDRLKMRRLKQQKIKAMGASPSKPFIRMSSSRSPIPSFHMGSAEKEGGLKKAEIDYKVKLKE